MCRYRRACIWTASASTLMRRSWKTCRRLRVTAGRRDRSRQSFAFSLFCPDFCLRGTRDERPVAGLVRKKYFKLIVDKTLAARRMKTRCSSDRHKKRETWKRTFFKHILLGSSSRVSPFFHDFSSLSLTGAARLSNLEDGRKHLSAPSQIMVDGRHQKAVETQPTFPLLPSHVVRGSEHRATRGRGGGGGRMSEREKMGGLAMNLPFLSPSNPFLLVTFPPS